VYGAIYREAAMSDLGLNGRNAVYQSADGLESYIILYGSVVIVITKCNIHKFSAFFFFGILRQTAIIFLCSIQ
jgi:hypothetical protein